MSSPRSVLHGGGVIPDEPSYPVSHRCRTTRKQRTYRASRSKRRVHAQEKLEHMMQMLGRSMRKVVDRDNYPNKTEETKDDRYDGLINDRSIFEHGIAKLNSEIVGNRLLLEYIDAHRGFIEKHLLRSI